jgi:hypothetical protein
MPHVAAIAVGLLTLFIHPLIGIGIFLLVIILILGT